MARSKEGTFKIGDMVKLKSGGPKMTVEERVGLPHIGDFEVASNERYRCQWFAGSKLESGIFPVDSLVKGDEDAGSKQ